MDIRLKDFIEGKRLDKPFASWLESLDEADSEALGSFVKVLKPSLNQLKDIAGFAREISKRDETSLAEELEEEGIRVFLANQKLSRNDKLQAVKKLLEQKRFPFKAQLEQRLEELKTQVRKNHGLLVEYPKDLEGLQISVSISGKNTQDFSEKAKRIEQFSKSQELEEIFSKLSGQD